MIPFLSPYWKHKESFSVYCGNLAKLLEVHFVGAFPWLALSGTADSESSAQLSWSPACISYCSGFSVPALPGVCSSLLWKVMTPCVHQALFSLGGSSLFAQGRPLLQIQKRSLIFQCWLFLFCHLESEVFETPSFQNWNIFKWVDCFRILWDLQKN